MHNIIVIKQHYIFGRRFRQFVIHVSLSSFGNNSFNFVATIRFLHIPSSNNSIFVKGQPFVALLKKVVRIKGSDQISTNFYESILKQYKYAAHIRNVFGGLNDGILVQEYSIWFQFFAINFDKSCAPSAKKFKMKCNCLYYHYYTCEWKVYPFSEHVNKPNMLETPFVLSFCQQHLFTKAASGLLLWMT